jgi:hypothetical protein
MQNGHLRVLKEDALKFWRIGSFDGRQLEFLKSIAIFFLFVMNNRLLTALNFHPEICVCLSPEIWTWGQPRLD